MHTTRYAEGMDIYTIDDGCLEVSPKWLFSKLSVMGCDISTYSYNENKIDIYGEYPKSKFIEIKKFFYDNYPFVSIIEPRKYGIRVHFKVETKISSALLY